MTLHVRIPQSIADYRGPRRPAWDARTPRDRARATARASASVAASVLSRSNRSERTAFEAATLGPIAAADAVLQSCGEYRSWPVGWHVTALPGELVFEERLPVGAVTVDAPAPCSAVRIAKNIGVALATGNRVFLELPRTAPASVVDFFRGIADRLPDEVLTVRLRSAAPISTSTFGVVLDEPDFFDETPPDELPEWLGLLTDRYLERSTIRVPIGTEERRMHGAMTADLFR